MSDAHRRKKDPERVRRNLIDSAKRLALAQGLTAVSLDAVAAEAGLTKGALFHHFESKQGLIDAVFEDMLEEFEAALAARLAADPDPHGRFTRAWLDYSIEGSDVPWAPLWMATITDARLKSLFGTWFLGQLARYDEADIRLEAVRFAADGIWLGHVLGIAPSEALCRHLMDMTRRA